MSSEYVEHALKLTQVQHECRQWAGNTENAHYNSSIHVENVRYAMFQHIESCKHGCYLCFKPRTLTTFLHWTHASKYDRTNQLLLARQEGRIRHVPRTPTVQPDMLQVCHLINMNLLSETNNISHTPVSDRWTFHSHSNQ